MYHAINVGVLCEHFLEEAQLRNVSNMQCWLLARNELDAPDALLRGIGKVVDNHDFIVSVE